MRRRLFVFAINVMMVCLLLTGCWNYRGLDTLSIVMGVSIDRDYDTGMYKISFEIADIAHAGGDGEMDSKIIESEGATVFEAVRNAKRKLLNKLYFAHMEIIVIGEMMAREHGIQSVIDWFKRDSEVRETAIILIAKGTDAHALITTEAIDQTIVSPEIMSIIAKDNNITSSTVYVRLFEVYTTLSETGTALTLPAVSIVQNDGKAVPEADGAAVFNEDKLVGFLSAEETKSFLLAKGKAKGGILSLSISHSDTIDTSLEIFDTKSDISYAYKDGVFTFKIFTKTEVSLGETMGDLDVMDPTQITSVEKMAGADVATGIAEMIRKGQVIYSEDILGFGALIRARDIKLWREIEHAWPFIYPNVSVDITSVVTIRNTAVIKLKENEKR